MLSLLRWGLGSGPDHFDEKERLQAVDKMANRSAMPLEAPRPPKRKRADGATNGSPVKQAKRQSVAHVRSPSINTDRPLDSPRVVNSPGVLAQLAGRDSVHAQPAKLVTTTPSVNEPYTPPSLLTQTDLGVVDLTTPPTKVAPIPVVETSKLQQTIATEFGLEILLKHKELRLIDQELAKCQVALEQLRRCQTIPYPSQSANSDARLNVSGGVGRPIRTSHARQATHPPPWGVADGPYTRHYAQWLLPDPTFDGAAPEEYALPRTGKMLPDRHTRGSKGEQFLLASKRLRGVPVTSRLQALPAGYPEPKEHKGPMILKRAADDKLVKLVCLDCKREDFNSAQGFINHCRIAHSRGFASHEAAAQACGQEVEPNDVAPAAPVGTPAETSTGILTPSGGLVHPLVKPTVPMLSIPIPRAQRAAASAPKTTPLAKNPKPPVIEVPPPTVGATHLSKLFALAGRKDDLGALVADAKYRTDLDMLSSAAGGSEDSDFDAGETSDASTNPAVMARMPSRGGLRAGPVKSTGPAVRPEANKGVGRPNRRAAAVQAEVHTATQHATLDLPDKNDELSPHTVESNNAPSLVSDNDDDDYEDGRTSTSPSSHSSDAEDDAHVDVDVEVDELPRLRGGSNHQLEPPRVTLPARKSEDPELQTSGNAKVVTRRGPRGVIVKPPQPKKRGRPRKVQP